MPNQARFPAAAAAPVSPVLRPAWLAGLALLALAGAGGCAKDEPVRQPAQAGVQEDTTHLDVTFGEPSFAGAGCDGGSAQAALSPDGRGASVIFSAFTAEAGGFGGYPFGFTECQLSIPVHLPSGYSLSVYGADFRGFASLPAGSRSELEAEYAICGAGGCRVGGTFREEIQGPYDANFLYRNENAQVSSTCGGTQTLRLNTRLVVRTNGNGALPVSTVGVDTLDLVSRGSDYRLSFRRCD